MCVFYWLLVLSRYLMPNISGSRIGLHLPGIVIGIPILAYHGPGSRHTYYVTVSVPICEHWTAYIFDRHLTAAALILLIRWLYKLIRHHEGIGLGDAKLMALLAAWLGLPGALLAFVLAAILGALAALILLAIPNARTNPQSWATSKLPFGTFLCIGGIVSSLWGQLILATYSAGPASRPNIVKSHRET